MSLYARNADPDTSHAAAESIDVAKLEQLVLTEIRKAGTYGMTQDELLIALPHLSYSSVTARPSGLKRKGYICDSGHRRPGRTGRNQAVLVASEFISRKEEAK